MSLKFRHLDEVNCEICGRPVVRVPQSHRLYCDTCTSNMESEYRRKSYHKNKELSGERPGPKEKVLPETTSTVLQPRIQGRFSPQNYCSRGHEYTPENTGYQVGGKYCKACKLIRERDRHNQLKRARMVHEIVEPTEYWPYGLNDPLAVSIARLLPHEMPEEVRADAGQQVYLEVLETNRARVNEGNLRELVTRAVKNAYGDWALSLDYKREDGFSIADSLEVGDLYI